LEKSIKMISDSEYTFSETHIIILDVATIANGFTRARRRSNILDIFFLNILGGEDR